MEKLEGEDCEIPSILGGEYGISPKKKRRDRFTSDMKDRQARGKDSMTGKEVKVEEEMDDSEKRDALGDGKGSAKINYMGDSYEAVERRKKAMAILDAPELLMMYAQERGDSIASSRYHLQHIMCGIEDTRKPLSPKKSTDTSEASAEAPEKGSDKPKHEAENEENAVDFGNLSINDGPASGGPPLFNS